MNNKNYKIMSHSQFGIGTHEGLITKRTRAGDLKAHTLICFDGDADTVKTAPVPEFFFRVVFQQTLCKRHHRHMQYIPLMDSF